MTAMVLRIGVARALTAAASAGLLLMASPTQAQTDFPNRRIDVIVPYPAGGIVDIVTRIVTNKLSETWRQPIVVEAKPGANGNIAWDQVARAAPDGYTWTFAGPALMANPRMYANLRWSEKAFVLVGARRSSEPSGHDAHRVHRLRPRASPCVQLGQPRQRHQPAPQHGDLPQCD